MCETKTQQYQGEKKQNKKTSDKTFVQPLLGTKQKADKQSDYE